jgi:hypothetical protein
MITKCPVSQPVPGRPETAKNDVENQIPDTMAMTQSDFTKQIDDMMNGIMLFIGAIASYRTPRGSHKYCDINAGERNAREPGK